VTAGGVGGEYDPFYTGTPPNRTLRVVHGVDGLEEEFFPIYAGGNAGTSAVPVFSHRLFEANDALATLNVPGVGGSGEDPASHLLFASENNLYDSASGGLYLVNVLPDAKTEANASFGSPGSPESSGVRPYGGSNIISADGSRIFWTATEGFWASGGATAKALYVRENDTRPQSPLGGVTGEECTVATDACTVQLDAKQPGAPGASGGGRFWAASSDGSRVFFTDCSELTEGSTAVSSQGCEHVENRGDVFTGNDLYEYELSPEAGRPGALRDLTTSTPGELALDEAAGDRLAADVQGVVASSEDGAYVYFAADGVLAGENTEGKRPTPRQPNLYLRHEGSTTFIATLSSADGGEVAPFSGACPSGAESCQGDWQAAGGDHTAEVTPGGQSLVFMSNRPLTGYDNATQIDGTGPVDEVFLFQAQSGKLACVSCNPSGEPPVATEFNTHYFNQPIGGFIPTSASATGEQPRVISEDGDRVFFDSGEPLLPTDTNGWMDVYEWELAGTPGGSCPEGAPGGGCIYLLSSGTDPENSYLLGADASGANAFFISRAQLVPADHGSDDDEVYDARVDGAQPQAEAACSGTGCQGVPPTPPIFATPSSVTFNGIGNFPPPPPPQKTAKKTVKCKKGETKNKKGKCVKKSKPKKKKTKTKRSAHVNRRAK